MTAKQAFVWLDPSCRYSDVRKENFRLTVDEGGHHPFAGHHEHDKRTCVAAVDTRIGSCMKRAASQPMRRRPWSYPVLRVRRLREYLAADEQLTRKVVIDTLVEVNYTTSEMLSVKGRRLRWSLVFLALTGLALAAGILMER